MPRKYTYGPFQSRRLGLSLGVDVLQKPKICTYNCVYCEIGVTDKLVSPEYRFSAPPSHGFGKELKDILNFFPKLNHIFSEYDSQYLWDKNIGIGSKNYEGIKHITIVEDAQYFAPEELSS